MKSVLYHHVTHTVSSNIQQSQINEREGGGISDSAKYVYLSSHYNIIFRREGKWKLENDKYLTFFTNSVGGLQSPHNYCFTLLMNICEYLNIYRAHCHCTSWSTISTSTRERWLQCCYNILSCILKFACLAFA